MQNLGAQNSTYLIIGASSGIGKALALHIAESGGHVFGTYNTHETQSDHPNIEYHHLNVLEEGNTLGFVPDVLTGLIYCPGTINLRPFQRITPSDFLHDYNLQVVGAVRVIQAVAKRLLASDNASITLFSTIAVHTGLPFHSQVAASKGAIEGLTRALAAEYAPKIRVNCIAPSLTDTPLASSLLNTEQKRLASAQRHPLKRVGTVDDIVSAVDYLTSNKASWVTGQILHVDGGLSTLRV